MDIRCAYTELKPIQELKALFHPQNRNFHPPEQIARLAKILEYQGARSPARISNRSGKITAGHGRILAAEHAGWESYPVEYQDYEDEAHEIADLNADNAIAGWSVLDIAGIGNDIIELGPDFDIEMLGLKDFAIEPAEKLEPGCDEDDVPDTLPEPKVVRGDLFTLGNHRLLCGDSTMIDDVERLMGGKKADMVCTDPPYGMMLDTNYSKMGNTKTSYRPVEGDDRPFDAHCIFAAFPDCGNFWLWGADYYSDTIPLYKDGNYIVWTKAHSEEENKVFTSRYELVWTYPKCKREVWFVRSIQHLHNERLGEHPTQKPLALTERILQKRSECNNVVDLFGGSGSTLIACEKTNRTCFMMEIDPHYCGVILDRWQKYSGKKAYREDGVAWDDIKAQAPADTLTESS